MGTERVSVVFRARDSGDDDRALLTSSQPIPSMAGWVVARASRAAADEVGERGWLVVLEVDLRGANLDPEDWLRNCHAFLVDSESGDDVGVVDDIELAPGSDQAVALVVASGLFGRHVRTIAVADVMAIVPGERRLIVRDAAAGSARAGRART